MRHVLKLVILSGIAVFFGVFISVVFNVTNGGTITITPDLLKDPHRVKLKSLNLSRNVQDTGYYELAVRGLDSFDILTGLAVGNETTSITGGAAIMVGGGNNNHINSSDSAGIVGGGNNNINNSQDAVIGGGDTNTIAGKESVVGGGFNNKVESDRGVILGGAEIYLPSSNIVLGGYDNGAYMNGLNNLLLGKKAQAKNQKSSFIWGGEDNYQCNSSADKSATLCAPKGILIGTYNGITGVNLVVNGAVKIGGDGLGEGLAGEIKMISGCFYAYNGSKWYVFGKSSKASGSCNAVTLGKTCKFGKIELQEGDEVSGYSVPYANDCNSVKKSVTCSDGSLSENVYSYCYKMEGVKWNLYEGGGYECVGDVPANATLVAGSDQGLTANTLRKLYDASEAEGRKCAYVCDDGFTKIGNQCRGSSMNLPDFDPGEYPVGGYSCEWPKPTGEGYIFTTNDPQNQHQVRPWTHVTDGAAQTSLGPCEYTCNISAGYTWDGTNSNCKKQQHWHLIGVHECESPVNFGDGILHAPITSCTPGDVCSTNDWQCQLGNECYGCS